MWGDYTLEVQWDGANWTNETTHFKSAAIRRGYDGNQETVQEGSADLNLWDTDGRYNPANPASPIYPYTAQPLCRVRVRCVYAATTYDLYTGYTRRVQSDQAPSVQAAQITCVDAFTILGEVKPIIAPVVTTTGGAIQMILDDAGFTDTTSLDTGDSITFSADGSQSGLALIGSLLAAERGFFFIAVDGTPTYRDRHWQNRGTGATVQATIADTMRTLATSADLDTIRNRATVTAEGGTPQTYSDAVSVARYFARDYSAITTPYLADDNAALALGEYLVSRRKDGVLPIRALKLNNGKATPYLALLGVDLSERVTVSDTLGGTTGDYQVMSIEHTIRASARHHTTTWGMVRRDTTQPLVWDVSTWDSTTDFWTY